MLPFFTVGISSSPSFYYYGCFSLAPKIYCLYWTDGAGIKKKLYTTGPKSMSYLLVRFIFSNNIPQILTTYQAYCPRI